MSPHVQIVRNPLAEVPISPDYALPVGLVEDRAHHAFFLRLFFHLKGTKALPGHQR